jgi:hypothetical protein
VRVRPAVAVATSATSTKPIVAMVEDERGIVGCGGGQVFKVCLCVCVLRVMSVQFAAGLFVPLKQTGQLAFFQATRFPNEFYDTCGNVNGRAETQRYHQIFGSGLKP